MRRSSLLFSKLWRFQDQANLSLPAVADGSCRVLFAGPHFQAAYPQTERVLLNRGHVVINNRSGAGGSSSSPAASSTRDMTNTKIIELIHAPSTEDLFHYGQDIHVTIPFMERFDADFLSPAVTPNLRLVIQFGVGLEGVDMEAATEHGIAVSNIPAHVSGNANATSEHALWLSMCLLRYAPNDLNRRFQAGELGGEPIPRTVFGKRVTLVGYGSVGRTLCHCFTHLGAQVTVIRSRPWPKDEEIATDTNFIKADSLIEALPSTDLLVLACTTTPETINMINRDTVSMLPKGALIVNVGRGPLVEHSAILEGLNTEQVGGFASDVGIGHPSKPSEPWDPTDELSIHPKCLFTPHVGGYTDYAYNSMANFVADAIESIMDGKPPEVWVNKSSS